VNISERITSGWRSRTCKDGAKSAHEALHVPGSVWTEAHFGRIKRTTSWNNARDVRKQQSLEKTIVPTTSMIPANSTATLTIKRLGLFMLAPDWRRRFLPRIKHYLEVNAAERVIRSHQAIEEATTNVDQFFANAVRCWAPKFELSYSYDSRKHK